MLRIALGTTSNNKITYLEELLEDLELATELIPVNADSGVTGQPRTENETKQGSINRARHALGLNPSAEIGLGIEIGYEPVDGLLYMHGWTSIIDKEGNIYSGQSSTLELPRFFHQYLHDHEDDGVGFHVKEFSEQKDERTWKYFANIIQYREPFIKESARDALLRYKFRDEY
jgi:inosine/xanthosine triphosphatase